MSNRNKQQQNGIAKSYKFNEKFEDSEGEDEELHHNEKRAKDMQLRGNSTQQNQHQNMLSNSQINLSVTKDNGRVSTMNQKPEAIPLIQIKKGKMEMCQNAVELLCKYSEQKIAFVVVVGLYRSGKSALLNKLLDIRSGNGFRVDESVSACTQGIWMWSNPEYNDRTDTYIFFIDSEGLHSVDQTTDHDTRIFTLSMLISSFFVYNSKGVLDDNSISSLALVTQLAKNIALNEYGERLDEYMIAQYAPKFLWLLRDFTLQIVDSQGRSISASQYLENALIDESGSTGKSGQSKKVKKAILAYFKDRQCMTMIKPINDEEKLKKLDYMGLEQCRDEFQKQVVALRSLIYQKCTAKVFQGQNLNGRMMCSMIETFVNNINDKGGVPNIESAWDNIVLNECVVAQQSSLQLFEGEMKQLLEGRESAIDPVELYAGFRSIRDNVLAKYESIAGIREKNQYYEKYRNELIVHMETREQQASDKNEDIAGVQNDELAKKLTDNIKYKIYKDEYNSDNIDTYISEFNEFLEQYRQNGVGRTKADALIDQIQQINSDFVKSITGGLKKDFQNKKESKAEMEQFNKEKEQYYKQQIELLDENILRFEDRIQGQDKLLTEYENDKAKQKKKVEDQKKEIDNLQKRVQKEIPEMQIEIDVKTREIEKLKGEIQLLNKKSKKKGCCG